MPTPDEIYTRVTKVLEQSLGVEEGDIKPSATLKGDLGAESIDFLDIVFRLERVFTIKINQDELFPEPLLVGGSAIIDDGRVTDDGLAALRIHMPYADWSNLERDRRLDRVDDLFTVDLVTSYIRQKLIGSGATEAEAQAPARRDSRDDRRLLATSTGSSAA
jgi:acyl carrier protein